MAAGAAATAVLGTAVAIAAVQAHDAQSTGRARHDGATPTLAAPAQAAAVAARPGGTAAALIFARVDYATGVRPVPRASRTPASSTPVAGQQAAGPAVGPLPRQLFVPDLIAAVPQGISQAQLARLRKLSGVRAVQAVSGGQVTIDGKAANVIGVPIQAFRAWTPPQSAANTAAWTSLARGGLLPDSAAVHRLGLKAGQSGQVTGTASVRLTAGPAAALAVPGVDAVVNSQRSAQLGLISNVAVLINAPGADLSALMVQIRGVIGARGQVRNLVPVVVVSKLPIAPVTLPAGHVPGSYLQLYQASAARYCPGLSWTVLAAIGEIESNNGANVGPSSAGALGPMQFLPSTWAIFGIDGFGRTGTPNIMDPLDAVPSAAHMLCTDGATTGGQGLSSAIFDYNHAAWYVNEVLQLAAEYAAAYP